MRDAAAQSNPIRLKTAARLPRVAVLFALPLLSLLAPSPSAAGSPPASPWEMAAATERWLVEGAGARFPEGMAFPAREADRFVWKENVRMVSTVLNMKREQFYVRFIGYFRETYGLLPDWCEPPLSWTIGNTTLSAEDWGILALYNGGGGIQKSYLPKHKPFHSPWVFIPQSDKKWDFLPNQNNYAEKVRRELEGLEPICE